MSTFLGVDIADWMTASDEDQAVKAKVPQAWEKSEQLLQCAQGQDARGTRVVGLLFGAQPKANDVRSLVRVATPQTLHKSGEVIRKTTSKFELLGVVVWCERHKRRW